MRKALKIFFRTLEVAFILLFLWCAINFDLVNYGISQGVGQLKIVWNVKPIEEVMSDSSVSDSLKQKLRLVEEIKKFAIDSLGLKQSKNYTTLYNQHGKPILWVLTASEKYQLKNYEWKFPVLGSVGYKGFFNYEKGKQQESKLKSEGYDTDYDEVSAWSTLGWFRDPILSNMLYRTEGQLAELLIHEMTHATLYVKSNVDFNENLASFVGEGGAALFLKAKYGSDSKEVTEYLFRKDDYDLFTKHILSGTKKLDSLYQTFTSVSDDEKSSKKEKMIKEIVSSLDTVSFHNRKRFSKLYTKGLPNNAYFMGFKRYDEKKDDFKKEMNEKFGADFKTYLNYLKEKYKD